MWVEMQPRRLDFCGRPPCPLCFRWAGNEGSPPMAGLERFALDLLQKPLDDLTSGQRTELNSLARKIHKDGLAALVEPPDETPPPPADIGMDSVRQLNGWLKERRRDAPPKPRQLTCDEVQDRVNVREEQQKAERKERDKRLKEAREVAAIFAEANRSQDERRRYEEDRYLRGVDPSFVEYCRQRGMTNPQEIAYRWEHKNMMRFDPTKGLGRYDY